MKNKFKFLFGIMFLFILVGSLNIVSATPLISFEDPTPANASFSTDEVIINLSITESNLKEVIWNWEGTNYSMFGDYFVLLMNMNNNSNLGENDTHLVDSSGYSNNGTVIEKAYPTPSGKYEGGFEFHGNYSALSVPAGDQYTIDLGNPTDLQFNENTSFSMGVWIKKYVNAGGIVHGVMGREFTYAIDLSGANEIRFGVRGAGTTVIGSNINDEQWYFVVGTYNNNTNDISLYVDGVEIDTIDAEDTFGSATAKFYIGDGESTNAPILGGNNEALNATLDEAFVTNTTLTAEQISEMYLANFKKYAPSEYTLLINKSILNESLKYFYQGFATDSSDVQNLTNLRWWGDVIPPTLSLFSPSTDSYYNQLAFNVSYNTSDSNLLSCRIDTGEDLPNSNRLYTCNQDSWVFLTCDGSVYTCNRNITVTVTDMAGNSVSNFTTLTLTSQNIGSTNSQEARQSWLRFALSYLMNYIKLEQNDPLDMGDFETETEYTWSGGAQAGESLTRITNDCKSGSGCLQMVYNLSNQVYRILYKDTPGRDFDGSNHTGIGLWVKGNGLSDNYLTIKLETAESGTAQENAGVSTSTAYDSNYRFYLNNSEWKYFYFDFAWFYNKSDASTTMPRSEYSKITRILFVVYNSSSENLGNVTFDQIEIVDFDKGSLYRQLNTTDNKRNSRYQEGVYNLAYHYKSNLTGYENNSAIKDAMLSMMDWLSIHQYEDGGWQEYATNQMYSTPASTGFVGISFMKTLNLIKNDDILNTYVNIYSHRNITNRTRGNLYNETAEIMANYTINWIFPTSWYSNQNFGAMHGAWLYANYSNQHTLYDPYINAELTVMNNTWHLQDAGFLPESNNTGRIGLDIGYETVTLFIADAFYRDSKFSILGDIIKGQDKLLLNTIGRPESYKMTLINGSRSATSGTINDEWDNYLNAVELNLYYKQQAFCNARNQSTSSSSGAYASSIPYRGTHWVVMQSEYPDIAFTCSGFKFPQNYSNYAYDLLTTNGAFSRRNTLETSTISSISQMEYPQMLFSYDNNSSWWVRGDYITTNGTDFIYSDTNGNFTIPIVPNIRTYNGNEIQLATNSSSNINTQNISVNQTEFAYTQDNFIKINNGQNKNSMKVFNYGLTNYLIYYSNNSIAGSSNINSNDGNINITLTPSNYSYVLDNFNLTEGANRANNPLWFSSSTDLAKHIASNLTATITTDITVDVLNCDIDYLYYTLDSGIKRTYSPSNWVCDSSTNTLTINLEVEPATSSNILEISYDTYVPGTGGGTTTPTIINPQSMLMSYPSQWQQERIVRVDINVKDKDNENYEPTSLSFSFNLSGITFLEQIYNGNTKTYQNTFEVTEDAKLGNYSIKAIAIDEKTIESIINFEVIAFDKDAPYIEPEPKPLDEITAKDWARENLVIIGIVGGIILIIFVFFIIVITDSKG